MICLFTKISKVNSSPDGDNVDWNALSLELGLPIHQLREEGIEFRAEKLGLFPDFNYLCCVFNKVHSHKELKEALVDIVCLLFVVCLMFR